MREVLIDTDIFSYYLKGERTVVKQILAYTKHYPILNLSSITYYEILSGLEHKQAAKQIKVFEQVLTKCKIINIDKPSMKLSAIEYGRLKRNGITIGNSDLLIAGVALSHQLNLVTNNTRHFKHINGLNLLNWQST